MSSYTKWDRAACTGRVDGEEEAERRRKALMARQSGHRLAGERKRHGLTQAQLAQAIPDGYPGSNGESWPPSTRSPATSKHYDFGDDWEHDIVVEAVTDAEPATACPRCLTGHGLPAGFPGNLLGRQVEHEIAGPGAASARC